MTRLPWLLPLALLAACEPDSIQDAAGAQESNDEEPRLAASATTESSKTGVRIKAEIWADNWFAFFLGETLIKEDSVPITTERSFNAESFTFTAEYPLVFNFVLKDFKENDTGLEYIGSFRQQMGDGGLIAQFTDADTGRLLAVTSDAWVCKVIHRAPLDRACEDESNPVAGELPCGFERIEEPEGWKQPEFDASAWPRAGVYSAAQVSPKHGYDDVEWHPSAQFIWGSDLEVDNTVLCRLTVVQ